MSVEPSLATTSSKAVNVVDSKASSNAARKEEAVPDSRQQEQSATSISAGIPHRDAMRAFRLLQQKTKRQEEKVATTKEVLEALRKFCSEGGE